ncbi:MAG: phosphate transport system protein [Candidatus Paceibacteria bacterium]|jgi:phosphate transport system protein
MTDHLHRDLARLKKNVLAMGGLAEEALQLARNTLSTRDPSHVVQLRGIEVRIDTLQLSIDDEIIKLLALHQPVASDLRFATAAMKIVNDLERVGDLATSIGERLLFILEQPPLPVPSRLEEMMQKTALMLNKSLDAFVALDSDMARAVILDDDMIDSINREHFELLVAAMKEDPMLIDRAVASLSISRSIERIADMSTNIAEDVVFVVEAMDIRHPGLAGRDL